MNKGLLCIADYENVFPMRLIFDRLFYRDEESRFENRLSK